MIDASRPLPPLVGRRGKCPHRTDSMPNNCVHPARLPRHLLGTRWRAACWSLHSQSRGVGCRGCRASHAAHFPRVNERRAAGLDRGWLEFIFVVPAHLSLKAAALCLAGLRVTCMPGSSPPSQRGKAEPPLPPHTSPPPYYSPAVSPFLHCPTRSCPACSRRGVSTSSRPAVPSSP